MRNAIGLGIIVVTLVTGCATPNVKYGVFTQDSPRTDPAPYADTYMLAKTVLTVSREQSADGQEESHKVTLRRIEDSTRSFGITPWNRMGVTTRLSLAKIDNTQLVQSVTVSVEDKRVEYIGEAFKLLSTITGVAPAAAPSTSKINRFPLVIDTYQLMGYHSCDRNTCTIKVLDTNRDPLDATLIVSPTPPDAIDVGAAVEKLNSAGGVFFSSACRQATLRVSIPGNDDLVSNFSLADPRYVQVVALPAKGVITAHSECGYSVVPEEVKLQSNLTVADSFFTELLKFKKAYEDSNKPKDDDSADE
jgi:hypothetical protein